MKEEEIKSMVQSILNCSPDEFYDIYREYKEAEKKFNDLYIPFKTKLLKLYEEHPDEIPKKTIMGGLKMVYVAPSTRTIIDGKKLKEEEPELVKKYSKTMDVSPTVRLDEI